MKYRHIIISAVLGLGSLGAGAAAPCAPGAEGFFSRARAMYATGNYTGAIDQLNQYLGVAPDQLMDAAPQREQAELLMLRATLMRSEFKAVQTGVEAFRTRYTGSPLLPEAELIGAEALFYQGRYPEALTAYAGLPLTPEARMHRAVALCETGHFDEARAIFAAPDMLHSAERRAESLFYLGYIDYVEGRDYQNALRLLRQVPEPVASQTGTDFYIAQILYRLHDYNGVVAMEQPLLRAANAIDSNRLPAVAEAWRILGESQYALGQELKARESLNRHTSLHTGGGVPSARYILGVMDYADGRYAQAEEWLAPVTAEDNELGQSALLYTGQAAARRGDYTSAAMSFDRAASMPYSAAVAETALYDYAAAVAAGGRVPFGSAASLLEQFDARYPDSRYSAAVHEYLAVGYMAEKRYDKALEKLDMIARPNAAVRDLKRQALYELGASSLGAGRAAAAERYLRRGVSEGGNDEVSRQSKLWLAESLYAQKKFTDAAQAYRDYIRSASRGDANLGVAYYNLGYALYQSGDYKACRSALEKAIEVRGTGALSSTLRSDAMLRKADCDNYLGNVKAALAAYAAAAEDAEGSPDYAALQAACMKGVLDDEAGKKAALEKMLSRWPSSPWTQQALYELAASCMATGDMEGASRAQQRLERVAPASPQLRQSRVQLASAYADAGHRDRAIELYKDVVRSWPSSTQAAEACEALQSLYADRGELNTYLRFLDSVPGAPRPQTAEMERLAYVSAQAALEKNPRDADPLMDYARRYPASRYTPDALLSAATVYRDTRNSDRALQALSTLLENYGHSEAALPALEMQGEIYLSKGEKYRRQATEAFRSLLSAGGAAYAPQAYEGLMKSAPDAPSAIAYADAYLGLATLTAEERYEAMMLKAEALVRAARPSEALELLRPLTADTSTSTGGRAVVKMAQIYLNNGKAAEAQKLMTAFTDQGCDDADTLARGYILLADAYTAQGNRRLARQYLEALRDNYPGSDQEILTQISSRLSKLKK